MGADRVLSGPDPLLRDELVRVGEHDPPPVLLPSSRLVGREAEVAALQAAFEDARSGRCRAVLVGGAPGVGKTALVGQLRPLVTGSGGWFVAGKSDQYRRDLEFDGVAQAFRALGRLLLAEPEDELAAVRERLLVALGPHAGLTTAVIPEFAALLAVPPDAGDPLTAQMRAQRNAVEILRAVASRRRPVVMFVDDLQWAGRTPLGLFDLVATEAPIEGLLLVGAYREGDVDATYLLAGLLSRSRDQAGVRQLRLDNLPAPSLAGMVAEMLHVDPASAEDLTGVIGPHTSGNPYETVELLDALRRAGLLAATARGWRWDDAAVRAHLGEAEPPALSAARIEALPPPSRAMMEAMACLGGQAELGLLQAAIGEPAARVEQAVAAGLQDGLVVAEGAQAVRFHHDRLREAVLAGLAPVRRRDLQLSMARRLADAPELFAAAAEQYLAVADAVDDPAERRRVVGLLRRAADQAQLIGNDARVNALLEAALPLCEPADTATLLKVHTARHAALYSLGRLEETDTEYRMIENLCPAALDRADATTLQVRSLTHRTRYAEAVGLAVRSLRELGVAVPTEDLLPAEAERQFRYLDRWLDHPDDADEPARPELTDPALLAATHLLNAATTAAYLAADHAALTWLSLEALRIWTNQGPAPALLYPVSGIAFATELRGDRAAGPRVLRRILAAGEARGYEPGTSQVRFVFSVLCWSFGPIDNAVQEAQRAREGLLASGDLATAGYASSVAACYLLDCAPALATCVAEVEAGLGFVRTGNEQVGQWLGCYRRLAGVLRGEGPAAGEAAPADRYAVNPPTLLHVCLTHAIAAVIFGDLAGLARHTAAAMPLLRAAWVRYPVAVTRLLRGLAVAQQAHSETGDQRAALVAELDEQIGWLAERAVDAPENFMHLVRWLEAERAWAAGDFRTAVLAFDAARREAAGRLRAWHKALIAERAARFFLAHGVAQVGHDLLIEARRDYAAWGATAKVAQLDWAHPGLRPGAARSAGLGRDHPADELPRHSTVTTGAPDLLGILSASQALSSETDLVKLHARVTQVLAALTGATHVHLLLWSDDQRDWLLPAAGGAAVPVSRAGNEHAMPMSVLRYAQRTGEPLFVADATDDDRFARDPHFTDLDCCSLAAMPIARRDRLHAVLLLENHFLRGAFTAERGAAITLIVGQLAVSLDNAQMYADFRRVADEQTALRRVATLVAQGEPPSTVLAAVAQEAGQLLSADLVLIGRYGDGPSVTAIVGWRHDGRAVPLGTDVRLGGQNVMSMVFSSGGPVRIEAYSEASGEVARWTQAAGIGSAVGVPITVEGRLWGVIMIALEHERPWQADTESRLANFTDLAATAIGNVSAHEQLREVADEQAALRRVATLVARGVPPDVVFGAVAQEVAHVLPAIDHAVIGRYTSRQSVEFVGGWKRAGESDWVGKTTALGGHNVSTAVFETRKPARVDHLDDEASATTAIARRSGARSSAGAPINVEGRLWGVMIVASAHVAELPAGIERELADFIELLATAIANTQAREEVRASRARIVAAADQARRRIERDVHDGAQQRLVSLGLQLRAAQASVPPELGELRAELDRAVDATSEAMEELQEIARGIHPAVLAQGGLRPALRTLARRAAIPVHLNPGAVGRLPDHVEISAYYVVAETLTNAAKHANASAVTVEVGRVDDILRISVRDDGIGGADFTGGSGLLGLKDRLEAIGGRILLDSPRDGGTEVIVELPLAGGDDPDGLFFRGRPLDE